MSTSRWWQRHKVNQECFCEFSANISENFSQQLKTRENLLFIFIPTCLCLFVCQAPHQDYSLGWAKVILVDLFNFQKLTLFDFQFPTSLAKNRTDRHTVVGHLHIWLIVALFKSFSKTFSMLRYFIIYPRQFCIYHKLHTQVYCSLCESKTHCGVCRPITRIHLEPWHFK